MSTSLETIQQINLLLPEFEAAVYDPLVETMMGTIEPGPELELARMNIARMPLCRETTEAGYVFLVANLGMTAVRYEVHAQIDEYHHFLSIGRSADLSGHDTLIDPTYLQYCKSARKADLGELNKRYSRVFVGTRYEVIDLMRGSDFRIDRLPIYQSETRISRI